MKYDIAGKVLIEKCREVLLKYFLGIQAAQSVILDELPQETVSVKRSDYPLKVTDQNGDSYLVILEMQSSWEADAALQLLEYRTRYMLKMGLPAVSCIMLLKEFTQAQDRYEDLEVQFNYRLIRLYEWDAREILDKGITCLAPFTPLMRHGEEVLIQAEEMIYYSDMSRPDKADMLTSMTILSGLVSTDLPVKLLNRRRDIMIESAAYELIKSEGIQQGIEQGIEQGLQKGFQKGISQSIRKLLIHGISTGDVARLLEIDIQTVLKVAQAPETEQ